jgi:Xaa-Pro aminopeptidase
MVKTAPEIARMRAAATIGADGIAHAAGFVTDGVDERGLEAELEAYCKRHGAERLPFASIIKSGPNSLWPWRILATHADRRNRRMHDGELVIFDVGCEIAGYTSDVGRTFPVSGRFTDEQRAILAMEVAVSDTIIAAMKPGVTLADVQRAGVAVIPPEHLPYMQTGLYFGHHIGLSSGDPSLADAPLEAGMVITVEPWYYNHDRGIAVFTEDDILITADGAENLTGHLPRTAESLERLAGVAARRP